MTPIKQVVSGVVSAAVAAAILVGVLAAPWSAFNRNVLVERTIANSKALEAHSKALEARSEALEALESLKVEALELHGQQHWLRNLIRQMPYAGKLLLEEAPFPCSADVHWEECIQSFTGRKVASKPSANVITDNVDSCETVSCVFRKVYLQENLSSITISDFFQLPGWEVYVIALVFVLIGLVLACKYLQNSRTSLQLSHDLQESKQQLEKLKELLKESVTQNTDSQNKLLDLRKELEEEQKEKMECDAMLKDSVNQNGEIRNKLADLRKELEEEQRAKMECETMLKDSLNKNDDIRNNLADLRKELGEEKIEEEEEVVKVEEEVEEVEEIEVE